MRWKVLRLCLLEFFSIKNSRGGVAAFSVFSQRVIYKKQKKKELTARKKLHVSEEKKPFVPIVFLLE